MDAASTPPEQKKQARADRHIPAEIVEEILLNLPVKSLLRFTSVSKSWRSLIFESGFCKKYRSRASLPGRERIVINPRPSDYLDEAFSCPLSSISSDRPIEDATEIISPIQGKPFLHFFCDGLWCVGVENSLFLWNPSMRTYTKLPDPETPPQPTIPSVYGMGYDSVGDDYKILRLRKVNIDDAPCSELYSLKSNSWRKTRPLSGNQIILSRKFEFVNGALHWIGSCSPSKKLVLISFDLSTEKYEEVSQPRYRRIPGENDGVEVSVLGGKLCLCLNYYRRASFVLWVMEDYGVVKSWAKKFAIHYKKSIPYFPPKPKTLISLLAVRHSSTYILRPLYLYDNGDSLIMISVGCANLGIFMYKNKEAMLQKIVGRGNYSKISGGFLYVESLVSPAVWPTAAQIVGNNE